MLACAGTRIPRLARLAAALAIASALALAHATAASAEDCAGAETEAAGQSTEALEASVFCLINLRRAEAGVGSVRTNPKLARAAAAHSNDMVQAGFFEHTSPGGDTFIDRIAASGYLRGARSWIVGENLVWGSGGLSTPASMVVAWMESPPHRANLLRGRFREIGLSAVRGTPEDAADGGGVTLTSEYGYRDLRKKRHRKSSRRAKARGRSRSERAGRR